MKSVLLFLSAAAAVLVMGEPVVQWDGGQKLVDTIWFRMGFTYGAELGYRSITTSGVDYYNDGWQFESVGLELFSLINTQVQFEILSIYRFNFKLKFVPFEIIPYQQWIGYTRPDGIYYYEYPEVENGFDIWLEGTYSLRLAKLSMEITHHAMSVKRSFVQFIMDPQHYAPIPLKLEDLDFNKDYKTVYEDPYWYLDVMNFIQKMGVNTKLSQYYGEQVPIWGRSILGKYDAIEDFI